MNTVNPIQTAIENVVNADALAGAVTLVWQNGKVIESSSVGWRDIEAKQPMQRDTIFRIASMTKPITSVAALMLFEEGRFALDDPITHWVPEFSQMRVLRSPTSPLDQTVPADRPITFDDLLTHRSGLTYGGFNNGPIGEAYDQALGSDLDSELSSDEWIAKLAALPLIAQPGAEFNYGQSTDLLGFVIARIAGVPLDVLLKRRIFDPLGMKDTGFIVRPENRHRRAMMYGFDDLERLTPRPQGLVKSGNAGKLVTERPDTMTYVSGGQGLWSTVDDYLAFARLFVGDGSVDNVRLLRPETLAMMTSNRLTDSQRATATLLGMPVFNAHGFGLGVAVVLDPEKASPLRCRGGIGTVGWPGAYGTWWQADPTNGSVMIFMTHNMIELEQFDQLVGFGVYGAITEFHALASELLQ
jgi:CubicO group peptidase (beta-lactamase class C family)